MKDFFGRTFAELATAAPAGSGAAISRLPLPVGVCPERDGRGIARQCHYKRPCTPPLAAPAREWENNYRALLVDIGLPCGAALFLTLPLKEGVFFVPIAIPGIADRNVHIPSG